MKTTVATSKRIKPMHPGEMIREDFLKDYNLTAYALSKRILVPQSRLSEILKGNRAITADTALRLARFFGNSAQFWMNLQADYDLRVANPSKIEKEVSPIAVAA